MSKLQGFDVKTFDVFTFLVLLQPKISEKMAKYQQKVIHLEIDGNHYYFGSVKALCDNFTKEQIGIKYTSLVQKNLSTPYKNKKCIIRAGVLITTPKKGEEDQKEKGAK